MKAMEGKRILIIGFVWPESNSSAAGHRMMQLITFFNERDYIVTFASTATESEFSDNLVGVFKQNIELNSSSFDSFVTELNPAIVVFDRYMVEEQFGWRVAQCCPNAIKILDTEDLHCLREARREQVLKNIAFDLNSDIAKREIASIYRCDLTLIISKFELSLLKNHFKVPLFLLLYLPIWVDEIECKLPLFESRKDFIFIGNFLHAPNHDAVLYLKEFIWPIIMKKLPDVQMHVYGAYLTEKIKACHSPKSNFFVKGRVTSIDNVFLNARLLLAPLRFGAGIKGKLLESMQYGTPNITTSVGAEGMAEGLQWNGGIEDSPERFAEQAIKLYEQKEEWETAQQNGLVIIRKRNTKVKFDSFFESTLNDIKNNVEKYRAQNFTGLMLQHHSMRSTKYMSKWIEEKNK